MASSSLSSSSLSTLRKSLYVANSNPNSQIPSISFPNFQQQTQAQTLTLTSNRKQLTLPPPHSSATSIAVAAASTSRSLKTRLKNGDTLYGIFLLTFSPTIAEIAGLAGYDFAVVDMEHGHGGISDALPCLHALAATNTAAVLRIPESSAAWAKKALDLGPQGIMFPMIDGPKSARKAVSYCRFPPNGVRGSAHTIVRASDYGIDEGYLSNFEEELLIMCQVESEEGVKKIDEIAAVDGVDCVQMGPLDLSASMGYLWDPGHKKVKEALRGAEKAVLKGGAAYLSGFVMPHDPAEELRGRGYHMVSGAADVGLFRKAAVEDVRRFKLSSVDDEKENAAVVAEEKYWNLSKFKIERGKAQEMATPKSNLFYTIILFLSIQTKVLCNIYQVGDLDAWGIPSSSNPKVYTNWANKFNGLKIGDSLFFLYPPSQDSLIQVTKESYDSCNLKDPILYMNNGNSLFNITKAGNFYFTSGVDGHCGKSQKLHIFVYGNGSYVEDSPASGPTASAPSYPTVFGAIPVQASSISPALEIPVLMAAAAAILLPLLVFVY